MVLSNAEKQKRWRDKRNALAEEAERLRNRGGQAKAGADATRLQAENAELKREIIELKLALQTWEPVIKARKGIMKHAMFQKILSCLHPDSQRASVTKS